MTNRVPALIAALVLLNASLTFGNVWPTPAIRFEWQLSVELALIVLLLAAVAWRSARPSARLLRWLTVLWLLLVVGHYADVTAPALYGREVNLFWDLRYVSDVAAMMTRVASWWLIAVILIVSGIALTLLYTATRWALRQVADATRRPRDRRLLVAAAAIVVVWFATDRALAERPVDPYEEETSVFAAPVLGTYTHQVRLAVTALAARAGSVTIAESPVLSSDLSRLHGADVLLVFIESYGAVTYDRAAFARTVAPARRALAAAAEDTGRKVVSGFVTSPTFGGLSWLAHLSLLSGVEVRDPDRYALLMSSRRDTLVTVFHNRGYRTVALMPGLQQAWPEGAFYQFDTIYGELALDYRGWSFGWWNIPDQYSLARFNQVELSKPDRRPVFAVFPTINTHAPFSPTPPYQADWHRVLSTDPFDQADLDRSFAEPPDWLDLGPDYVRSVIYDLTALAGFVRERRGHDLVMIILGDHQPASMVSGTHAPWDVPVHIVAAPGPVLDRLVADGFQEGVDPPRAPLGRMNELGPMVVSAFGEPEPSTTASPASY